MSSRQGRTLIIALVCSVALNLLIIGGIVGHFVSGPGGRPFPSHLGWMVSDLDEDTRKTLRPILRQYAKHARPLRREMAKAQKEFEAALTKEPLDDEEVQRALDKLQQVSSTNQSSLHLQMIGIMKELKPEERIKALRYMHRREPGRARPQRDRPSHKP
jgi:uncharacterized membrane protein